MPLDAINVAAARENYIYKGNPSAIHKWWAQRPLAAARAVVFAQLVNDPGYHQGGGFRYGKNKKDAAEERKRLFKIIEDLVVWENTSNEVVLERARAEIRRSWREVCELNKDHPDAAVLFNPDKLPSLHDPFAGGGTIPLEAQRLGLNTYASDLNPLSVTINKAILEHPPVFSGQPPVSLATAASAANKNDLGLEQVWHRASGLSADVRFYAEWMRSEAQKRIGDLYPPFEITSEIAAERPELNKFVGQKFPVIAWLWCRTVKSPNPAFSHVSVPLATSFVVSSKEGRESYVHPIVNGDAYRFTVRVGTPTLEAELGTKAAGRGANFRCLVSDTVIDGDYIKNEGQQGRIGAKLMAVVIDGPRGRTYLPPTTEAEGIAFAARPVWRPEGDVPSRLTGGTCVPYGMKEWGDLFTNRQLVGLTVLSDLVNEVRSRILQDATDSIQKGHWKCKDSKCSAQLYSEAVSCYLAFAVSKTSEYSSSLTVWYSKEDRPKGLFARQAIPMVWDFVEQNLLGDIGGSFIKSAYIVADSLAATNAGLPGIVFQANASLATNVINEPVFISTDPPYYDNIAYADLSDFFYVWLRRSIRPIYPDLFATIAVPKAEELVAAAYRHGSKEKAETFFLNGMTSAMRLLASRAHPAAPLTIYYAFKQSETKAEAGTASTGWVTFLAAVVESGLQVTGTWPMRTERQSRAIGIGSNSLASSIILVCHKRPVDSVTISRRDFIRELNIVLPEALDEMTKGAGGEYSPVAPVDLSQAIIGPGMAVFSKYAAVLEADGEPMTVRTALQLINRFLAEDDFDADTQWCLRWFEQHGWSEGAFGEADVLARSKSISVSGLAEAGVVVSGGGKVGLRKWADYPIDWDPRADTRQPVWETLHHLIRALKQDGEGGAGKLLGAVKAKSEATRQLAYRLYTLCERQGWAEDARAYNELITSWTGIESVAGTVPEGQGELFT